MNYTDSVTGTWSMTDGDGDSGYDSLNRLIAASATSGPYAGLQATWNYDSFGNRTFENFSGSLSGQAPPIPPSSWAQYNANNQVQSSSTGVTPTYDASGDVTQDDQNQYLYDAEGRVCASLDRMSGAMTGYLYDAEGNRVAKGPITSFSCDTASNGFGATGSDNLYILGPSGQQLTEMTWSGNQAVFGYTNVRAAGQLIGSYTPGSGSQVVLKFQLRDWLGTLRAQTDYAGNVLEKCESLPYGNGQTCVTSGYLFTGKERDTESGNDYFGARYYASSMGRFLSPDWSAKEDPVPYAKLDDPQTLNLYSYVGNNPLARADADGHCFPLCLAVAGGGALLADEAPLALTGPVGWTVIGVTALGVGGVALYEHFHQDAPAPAATPAPASTPAAPTTPAPTTGTTPLPTGLVGTDQRPSKGRTNSGPLAPENGGAGDAGKDFGTLTGGKSGPAPQGSTYPPGTQVGDNGIALRPAAGKSGPRIDIPANGDKPHETLHYPPPPPPPPTQPKP